MEQAQATKFDWQPENARLVISGEDGTSLSVPLEMMSMLGMQARRVMAAHHPKPEARPSGWQKVTALPIETVRVQTLVSASGTLCLLTLDPDTNVELQLFFRSNDTARQVGDELVRVAIAAASEMKS